MRNQLSLLLLLPAAATGWLGYETLSAMLAAPAAGMVTPGTLRGLLFALTMCAITVGLLWIVMRALRPRRS